MQRTRAHSVSFVIIMCAPMQRCTRVCLNRDVEPHERLTALIFSFISAQLVYVMARLRLADLVADGPMTIDELSSLTDTRPDILLRVMRGLEGLGLVGVESDGRISVTDRRVTGFGCCGIAAAGSAARRRGGLPSLGEARTHCTNG